MPTQSDGLVRRLKQIGPALVLAAVVLGPGSVTLSTLAGGLYGYRLLWVVLFAGLFMMVYTVMAARISSVSGKTLFGATRMKFGSGTAKVGGLLGFLSILAFQAGNSAGVGFAAQALWGLDSRLGGAIFFLPALALLLAPNLYRKLEWIVKIVVGLMIVGFVGTLLIVGVDFGSAAVGLLPGFPDGASVFLALGLAATTFSIAAAAYQSHLVREKGWGPEDLFTEGLDTLLGIAILSGISAVILLTSARVLYGTGAEVLSAQAMALQLEPLFGPAAFYLFTLGFLLASFSSLVVNPLVGATLLVDGFRGRASMEERTVRYWSVLAMSFGLLVVVLFGRSPLELLRLAQALAVVAFPVLGLLVWALAADKTLMGRHANPGWVNVLAALGYFTIVGIAVNYLRQIVFL